MNSPLPLDDCLAREAAWLAPFAMPSGASAGRKHAESSHPYRAPFQRDRDRIVHSSAYRRLSYKTQVFTGELGDYHRSRLTHTLECSSIARTLARALRLNEDLVEALALAHDIGHPPFGHAGEDTLDECLRDAGGFNHNAQALRIFEVLECRYPSFSGLNLSHEVLAGQHFRTEKDATDASPLLEAQVVDAADSVAYDTHDADDALVLGLITLDELAAVPLWAAATARVRTKFSALRTDELRRAVVHELIDWQVNDLLAATRGRIDGIGIATLNDVRRAPRLALPSDEMTQQKDELEAMLYRTVYRHPQVLRLRTEVQSGLRKTFDHYSARPDELPPEFSVRVPQDGLPRAVGDYLACLTDRAAQREFKRLFG